MIGHRCRSIDASFDADPTRPSMKRRGINSVEIGIRVLDWYIQFPIGCSNLGSFESIQKSEDGPNETKSIVDL